PGRGDGLERGRVGPNPFAQPGRGRAAVFQIVAHHHRQVIDTDISDGAAVQVRLAHHAHQRGICTVARAVDADPLRVGVALLDRPAGGVGDIVLHRAAPLARACLPERATVVAGPAEADLPPRTPGGGPN